MRAIQRRVAQDRDEILKQLNIKIKNLDTLDYTQLVELSTNKALKKFQADNTIDLIASSDKEDGAKDEQVVQAEQQIKDTSDDNLKIYLRQASDKYKLSKVQLYNHFKSILT